MSRAARAAARLAPPLLAALLALVAVEAWLRVARFGSAALLRPLEFGPPMFRPVDCLAPGPDGEPLRPRCRMFFQGVALETNAAGMNGPAVDESAPHYRIAVLGDSVTMPEGVERDRAYHVLLAERLNATLDAPGFVAAYNFGRRNQSTTQEVALLERVGEHIPFDAVLVAFTPTDLLDNVLERETCRPTDAALLATEAERAFQRRHVLGRTRATDAVLVLESRTGLWTFHVAGAYLRNASRTRPLPPASAARMQDLETRALTIFRSCVSRLRERAEASDTSLAWAQMWYRPKRKGALLTRELEALGEPVVSMASVHEAFEPGTELGIYPGDRHPDARVHAVYAVRLYDFVAELGWIERIRAARAARTADGGLRAAPPSAK